jgi:hypothetical protein
LSDQAWNSDFADGLKLQAPMFTAGQMRAYVDADRAQRAAAPQAVLPWEYPFFSHDTECGTEFHKTEAEAINWCEEVLQGYREEAGEGWAEEVESISWGVVLGRAVKCNAEPLPEHHEFTETCDYELITVTQPAAQQFQALVGKWLIECFGSDIAHDGMERNHRFLEEALELVQSLGCVASEAHQLVDYVFGRPVGEPIQELGGVMVTLAALCFAHELDMAAGADKELARICDPATMAKIKAKQAAKPRHSPLPQPAAQGLKADGMYYLQDARHHAMVGNCPSFRRPDGNGYTTNLDEAARFTFEDAMKQHQCRETDLPWLCTEVDKLRRPTVDCQYMPRSWDTQRAALAAQAKQGAPNGQ